MVDELRRREVDRARLLAELAHAGHRSGDVVFIERCGDEYRWSRLPPEEASRLTPGQRPGPDPDAWMAYTGPWPSDRPAEMPGFLEDLLAEMESMCGGADRCRWPLDQPYPHGH
jgi:hypothetical protein